MKVPLPSGHTAEFRDTLMRGDIREAKRGVKVVISPDGSRTIEGSLVEDMTGRIVTRMLTGWDFGQPLPREAQTEGLQQRILDEVLDSEDWQAVKAAAGPWVEACLDTEKPDVFTHVSGVRVQAATAADAEALDASPDFTREGGGPDSKNASRAIGTSSSASPGPDGQPATTPDSTPRTSS